MSFLAEVLASAEQCEMVELNEKISTITQKIASLKVEMKNMMEENYVKLNINPQEPEFLRTKANILADEIKALNTKVETQTKRDLKNSTGELKRLSVALQEACAKLQYVDRLVSIDRELKLVSEFRSRKKYLDEAKALKNLSDLLKQSSRTDDPEIFKALLLEKTYSYECFIHEMMEIWNTSLRWEETILSNNEVLFVLKVETGRRNEIEHMMQALVTYEHLDFSLNKFSNKLLKNLLSPVITRVSCVEQQMDNDTAILEVEVKSSENKPSYNDVFTNLKKMFGFISKHLSFQIDNGLTFVNKIGEVISEEFCSLLIKECLSENIPSRSEGLEAFSVVAKATEEIQELLVSIGFLNIGNQSLLQYAKNVDVLCANKECQLILENARNIMKKDLHDVEKVGPKVPSERFLVVGKEDNNKQFVNLKPDPLLSDDTFQFPECKVSKSTLELVTLVEGVMDEATQSSELCSTRLFYTVRNIFELYAVVVPTFHKEFLETIPQHAAVFHNNCMYLAHRLVTLGHEYQGRLPSSLAGHTVTFVDLVQKLRELGTETFLKRMRAQKSQLLSFLQDSGLATLGKVPTLPQDTEKSVRQCLRHLQLLQKVWQDILPTNVYEKSLGCLTNAFINELIIRVVTVEDIPAETATQLTGIYKIVIDRAPQVFKDKREVHRHVTYWQKFQELVLVLGASLMEIDDRWADGKGPLAYVFTPNEVKQLIRALFQNTEKRAALLIKIK